MIQEWLNRLTEPAETIAAPHERVQARYVSLVALFVLALAIMVSTPTIFLGMTSHTPAGRIFAVMFVVVTLVPLYWLTRTKYYRVAAWLLVILSSIYVYSLSLPSISTFDHSTDILYFLIIPLLFGSLFLPFRWVTGIFVFHSVSIFLWSQLVLDESFSQVTTTILSGYWFIGGTAVLVNRYFRFVIQHESEARAVGEERYRLLVESSPDMIGVYDTETVFYLNQRALDLLENTGNPLPRNTDLKWEDVLPAPMVEVVRPLIEEAFTWQTVGLQELALDLPKVGKANFEVVTSVVNYEGRPAVQGVARDVSERKRLEAERQQLDDERERTRLLSNFITGISHDLRTPLAQIGTKVYLTRIQGVNERQAKNLDIIEESVARVLRVIDDTLTLTRLDETTAATFEPRSLPQLLAEFTDAFLMLAKNKNIKIVIEDSEDDIPPVWVEHQQFGRAITNLVENAVRYSPANTTVTLRAGCDNQHATLSVQDQGIGIPEGERERIFERFYRSKAARQATSTGTGLGLAIVKQIVERHGGHIKLESVEGKGSTFTIHFPIISPQQKLSIRN